MYESAMRVIAWLEEPHSFNGLASSDADGKDGGEAKHKDKSGGGSKDMASDQVVRPEDACR